MSLFFRNFYVLTLLFILSDRCNKMATNYRDLPSLLALVVDDRDELELIHSMRNSGQETLTLLADTHSSLASVELGLLTRVTSERRDWSFPRYSLFYERTVMEWPDDIFVSRFRLTKNTFELLVNKLSPYMEREETLLRSTITVSKRVAIGLYFLASGVQYKTVADCFGVGISTAHSIVDQFCAF